MNKLAKLLNKLIFIVIVTNFLFTLHFNDNVLAADLLEINFRAKTDQNKACVTNKVVVLDENNNQQGNESQAQTSIGGEACEDGSVAHGDSDLANFAIDLIEAFDTYCGAPITSSNYTCIQEYIFNSAQTQYPTEVFNEIQASSTNYGCPRDGYGRVTGTCVFQCVGFVSAVAASVNGQRIATGGCASNAAGPGALTSTEAYEWVPYSEAATIKSGDFPIWTDGCGHMAVVIEVQGNYGFKVAEALGTDGSTGTRIFQKSQVAGWWRKQ